LVESDPTAEYIVTLLSTTDLPNQPSLKARGLAWRLLSASEVLVGAAIVIGHNVFRVVPNEVPILFVLVSSRSASAMADGRRSDSDDLNHGFVLF